MPDPGERLPTLARHAIADHLGIAHPPDTAPPPALLTPGASFVTLTRAGQLRGCIGSLEAWRPLLEDVRQNALAAAFRDPRFSPLRAAEWPEIALEVSVLSAPEFLAVSDEEDACRQLQPGRDGVILQAGARRATFLPQVWEKLPDPHDFLAQLKVKAGLPAVGWGPELRLERYTVHAWHG